MKTGQGVKITLSQQKITCGLGTHEGGKIFSKFYIGKSQFVNIKELWEINITLYLSKF